MIKKINIDPAIKIRTPSELLHLPVVIRVNKFNEESSKTFSKEINRAVETGQPVIPIVVDSYGGSPYSLLSMISEIESCKLPVATICESKAMSAGCFLFSLGNNGMRYLSPHATLMLHEVSSSQFGKVEDLKADTEEIERLNQHLFELLAKKCGKKPSYFLDLIHKNKHADWYPTPHEAKKHGLCDHIKLPTFTLTVSTTYEFE